MLTRVHFLNWLQARLSELEPEARAAGLMNHVFFVVFILNHAHPFMVMVKGWAMCLIQTKQNLGAMTNLCVELEKPVQSLYAPSNNL